MSYELLWLLLGHDLKTVVLAVEHILGIKK